jgi:outer membrane protein OmpA-like peptidoglycan-associated protein
VPRFEPAPAGDRFFGVGSADVPGRLTFHAGLVFDYAHRPFVFKDTDSGDVVSSLIEHTLLMHAQASLALWDRLELSLSLPVALSQSGDDPVYHGERTNSPSGGGLGDLRVGVRVRLFGLRGAAFQLGLGGYLWLPTGSEKELLSDGKVRGAPLLNASGRVKRFIWASQAGVELRSAMTLYGAHEGSMLRLGGAGGVLVGKRERGQLGAELSGQLVLRDPSSLTSGVELLASGKWRFVKDFELGAAVGPGLLGGIGTPSVRALASLMYTPQQTDQTAKKPKPVADQDGDGVPDDADACPRDAGPAQSDAGTPGCPAPVLAPLAVAPAAPAPVDSDGDGVSDDNDACPNEAGTATATRPGCPEPAPVPEPAPQPTSETLPERLKFALGNASVTPAQAGSIDKVRERMQQNPSKKLRIEGHSDDLGALDYNQQLSEQRAESAKAALMRAGIPAERLETRGFGPTRPLVQGTSPEARAQNRRVEFVLHD